MALAQVSDSLLQRRSRGTPGVFDQGAGVMRALAVVAVVTATLAAGCRSEESAVTSTTEADRVSARTIQVFYESPAMLLVPEIRSVTLPENDAAALALVIRELLKGSANASIPRSLPSDTVLRAAYLLPDGNAIVDLGGATLTAGWNTGSHQELIAAYSIVETVVANFPSVRQVRLLINGQVPGTLGGHVDLDKPLRPLAYLVAKR